ncbi:hemolysin-III related [Planctomycetes bacterium Pan216]|uniref:Hemolysin-III related n=1 Tax=Kolteria novifilia TaxID=2527975 RepID=A0A518B827_9BACT|nr:hemolysin-III related [Planctomycetes bacterium Pan216]
MLPWHHPEEIANGLTHGLGLLLSLVGGTAMLRVVLSEGTPWKIVGCGIYVGALIAVYLASTVSHLAQEPGFKDTWRRIDQAVIYLLVVGTYTPFALAYLCFGWWWLLFGTLWAIALFGFVTKLGAHHRLESVHVWSYVMLGWLPLIEIGPILSQLPPESFQMVLVGGVFYTAGTFFLVLDHRVPFFHSVWHLFVIAGSVTHYLALMQYVVPLQA